MNQPGTLAAGHAAANERLARIGRIWRAAAGQFPIAVLVLVLGFLVLYPIGAVVLNSLLTGATDEAVGFSAWQEAFREPGLIRSITNTFKVQLVTQGISLPVAILIAWILARTDVPFGRTIEFGFWIMFFLPALGVTTGWLLFFDAHFGLANRWLMELGIVDSAPFDMFSYWGIVFAHLTTYAVSVKVMLLTPAFRNLDGAIEEASRICGASPLGTLLRVVVPIMTPAIFVVFLMSLIRGLEAFEIELFLGMPFDFMVYSTEIYRLVANAPPDYAKASVLATSILVTMLPLIILQRWAATRRSYAVVSGKSTANLTPLGRWRWPMFLLLLCLVCFMSLLPLTLLITGSFMTLFGFFDVPNLWTANHWQTALDDSTFAMGFRNMLVLGAGTALVAVVVYSLVAYCTVRLKSLWQAPLDILSWLPLAIPGIILGFGYLFMLLQVPVFRALYGTLFALILVSFLASMTLGVQVLKVHMLQIGEEVEEAGRVVGGSWLRTFRSIITPLTAPALAVVGVLIFASTIRQIGSIILLATGETRVLALLQLEFLADGRLGPAAVIGTVIVLISLLAAVLIRIVSVRFGIRAGPG